MARRSDLLDPKAKARKQKKQAAVLGVVFLAVCAFTVPKTLKMMNPPAPVQAAPPPASATAAPATGAAPAATAEPASGAAQPAAAAGNDALVVNSDLSPAPLEGQFEQLTSFDAKDPFRQQATPEDPTLAAGAAQPSPDASRDAGKAPGTGFTKPPAAPAGGSAGSPAAPPAPAPTAATISVNGVEEVVSVDVDFPQAAPVFHLVSLTAKTAKISIAGGSLANGAPTLTLRLRKPLTLMNTADGTRYVLLLVSTNPTAAAPVAPSSAPAATTTPGR